MILKLNNGQNIQCVLKENNNIDMQIILQNLLSLSEKMYSEDIDCVSASYELDGILDELIDM